MSRLVIKLPYPLIASCLIIIFILLIYGAFSPWLNLYRTILEARSRKIYAESLSESCQISEFVCKIEEKKAD